MIKVEGKNGISAKMLADSISNGNRMRTYELEMPRIVLAELNTHKILFRNSQSSRAVPVQSAIANVRENGFVPTFWGKKKGGMVAVEETENLVKIGKKEYTREAAWKLASESAISFADAFDKAEYHKQIAGRILEPFQMIRVVFGGTEFDNLYNLRIEPTAQPEFRELAKCIYNAQLQSTPIELKYGEWHTPYVNRYRMSDGSLVYLDDEDNPITTHDAINISLSSIAQVSYRKLDTSIEKANDIIGKLFSGDVVHASPAENVCTPIITNLNKENVERNIPNRFDTWEEGITHVDRNGQLWSSGLKGFIQYRQLVNNHDCKKFTHEKYLEYTKND